MQNRLAPIALFTYNRPHHTARTLNYLVRNKLASSSDLVVFSDGPKAGSGEEALLRIKEVRDLVSGIEGFKSVKILAGKENKGLARSITGGVSQLVGEHGKVIVLEDDMITSPAFLSYMNWGIDTYSSDDKVVSIHGYVNPSIRPLPDTFFRYGADCWGWATWDTAWAHFNPDGSELLARIREQGLQYDFDLEGSEPFSQMLEDQTNGLNDSWAIRWHASAFLAKKLTLYPGTSYVKNIGLDGSGTHFGDRDTVNIGIDELNRKEQHARITIEQDDDAVHLVAESVKRANRPPLHRRMARRIKEWIGRPVDRPGDTK